MTEMNTKTGLGYYKDQDDHIIAKYDLPPGQHILKEGLIFIEVNNREELDHIEIYREPSEVQRQGYVSMISKRARQIAIEQLKAEGKLPPDYTEP